MSETNREQDKKEILQHIDSIFKAFSTKDRVLLEKTHMPNWKGFTVRSRMTLHNREEYLQDISSLLEYQKYSSYEIMDEDFAFYGDTAILCYIARVHGTDSRGNEFTTKLRIIDIYVKTDDGWNNASSSVSLHPDAIDRHLSAAVAAFKSEY